jgi:beta-glucanase (GH16 family)
VTKNSPGLSALFTGLALGVAGGSAGAQVSDWQLIWSDEFEGVALDTTKWRAEDAYIHFNNELQYYTPQDASVQSGWLRITSERRNFNGRPYTSALVQTRDLFAQTYGRVEIRARLPRGQGMWPAHWMLPQSGQWPPEIDIMESLGNQPTRVYMTQHWGTPANHGSTGGAFTGPDYSADFHTFAIEWSPDRIDWLVDGVNRFSSTVNIPREPFYIILNTAVGGDWPGSPDGTTIFPQYHDIDYVRVYAPSDPGPPLATIVDTSSVQAAADGIIGADEYAGSLSGINSGIGGRLGAAAQLYLNSDASGRLFLALHGASAWPTQTSDGVVIYVDSVTGGFTSTIALRDHADLGRALTSGKGRATGTGSQLYFADGFAADYAIFLQDTFAGIFRLGAASHTFVTGASLNAATDVFGGDSIHYVRSATDPTIRELRVRLADLGVAQGDGFGAVATILNGDTGVRYNEFLGVATGGWWDATPSTSSAVQLHPGDFFRFVSSAACTVDLNGDGQVNVADYLRYLALFASGAPAADIDGDGAVNIADFLAFLRAYAAGCD